MIDHARGVPIALRPLHEPPLTDPVGLFDATRERLLHGGDVAQAIDILSDGLWWMRRTPRPRYWRQVIDLMRAHPVMGLLHENPFSRRAFVKPRGYAGDAPLVDLLLFGRAAEEARGASNLGLALLDRDATMPLALALRERRDFVAELIDHVADLVAMPSVLVVGCGHLREGLASSAVRQHRLGRLAAFEPDAASLREAARLLGINGIEPVNRSITALTEGLFSEDAFHMICAAGLYDTLSDAFARELTQSLFAMLKPGGRLVIANCARDIYDAGYLEACADWFPHFRGADEMLGLAALIPPDVPVMRRVYTRYSPDIFYLELRKRGALRG